MERVIRVRDSKTQKTYKITTNASTIGELKKIFSDNGINYQNMDITEGISKATLTGTDNTPLPTNIPYKGTFTNDLVILLTNTRKNISSGMATRGEVYNLIKAHSLQEVIKNKFGRNFTQVPTIDLIQVLTENGINPDAPATTVNDRPEEVKPLEKPLSAHVVEIKDVENLDIKDIIINIVKSFIDKDLLDDDDIYDISGKLEDIAYEMSNPHDSNDGGIAGYSQKEIDELASI